MSDYTLSSYQLAPAGRQLLGHTRPERPAAGRLSSANLAAAITREASSQTFFTIRYLADRPLVADAYRAYAYFRWVDDVLDQDQTGLAARLAFLTRQQAIISRCYQQQTPPALLPQEEMIVDLIHNNQVGPAGLRTYIDQMLAVMAFDANRQGRLVSQKALDDYTRSLATAVSEALHYFIGRQGHSPGGQARYAAVTGAHIVHMLRDTLEDIAVGYYNVPREFLDAHGLAPTNVHDQAYRSWVQTRIQEARDCFAAGRAYTRQLKSARLRLAGYAYIARFEVVLRAIEKDDYRLRAAYPERKSKSAALQMGLSALSQMIRSPLDFGLLS